MKNKKLIFLTVIVALMGLMIVITNLPIKQQDSKLDEIPKKEKIDELPVVNSNGNFVSYENFDTLEQNSELIIIAQAT
ncbi:MULTISPECIES: hypothetical protein [unclassified Lysinibacillus]|uniref:hypothetical protein n=1 Tax=unclassified Lysinibacillus TaxID=2636778 RepID=UPI003824E396